MKTLYLFLLMNAFFLTGCTGIPDNITPVDNFHIERYTGTWYEIARLDHKFERGLEKVSATYTLREDGGVNVLNRGYDVKNDEWKQVEGVAYFVDEPDVGHLKVSFFKPFYGSYIIFKLDEIAYQYALVCGANRDYLWLLARTPVIEKTLKDELVKHAAEKGFATNELIYVTH